MTLQGKPIGRPGGGDRADASYGWGRAVHCEASCGWKELCVSLRPQTHFLEPCPLVPTLPDALQAMLLAPPLPSQVCSFSEAPSDPTTSQHSMSFPWPLWVSAGRGKPLKLAQPRGMRACVPILVALGRISVLQLLDELLGADEGPVGGQKGFAVQHQVCREQGSGSVGVGQLGARAVGESACVPEEATHTLSNSQERLVGPGQPRSRGSEARSGPVERDFNQSVMPSLARGRDWTRGSRVRPWSSTGGLWPSGSRT